MAAVTCGGSHSGSDNTKRSLSCERSNSVRGSCSDTGTSGSGSGKVSGGGWNRSSISHHSCVVRRGSNLGARVAVLPARATVGLSSSRSSPSLHTSSLSATPFIGTCCSLSRLDQSSAGDDAETGREEEEEARPPVKSGSSSLEKATLESQQLASPCTPGEPSRANVRDQCDGDNIEQMDSSSFSGPPSPSSVGSTAAYHLHRNRLKKQEPSVDSASQRSIPDVSRPSLPGDRRSKSLDCRAAEASATPDLLNFKKGWMMRLDTDGQWKKHWFVLTDQILRFFRDSVAEEAADMDGEINLSTCYDITDYPSQKNYGFQIHTKDGMYTLCAMSSGIRRNWVQAVLKHVRPTLTPDVTSSLPEQRTPLKSQRPDVQSAEVVGHTAQQKTRVREYCLEGCHKAFEWAAVTQQQQREQDSIVQAERGQDTADGSFASSPVSSVPSSSSRCLRDIPSQGKVGPENDRALCHLGTHVNGPTEKGVSTTSSGVEKSQSKDTSTPRPAGDHGGGEHADIQVEIEQGWRQAETTTMREERQVSIATTCECMKERERLSYEQQTGKLDKELEQTQRELSRLQQFNRTLQDQLQQEREHHSREGHFLQNGLLSISTSSSAQAMAFQRLQKMNQDLLFELEAQRRSQEEAKEAELQRRAELLAQQAHLLVTGDATALSYTEPKQDWRRPREQQEEWERCVASLRSQLSISEGQRRESETRLLQLQEACQGYQGLQREADRLRERLQDVSARLRVNEEAQVQKEVRLQKHLVLLQESQDRERRSLAASLAQAERHSQELQEQLEGAKQQVESLTKGQSWTKDVEEAQQQLQEELSCTMAAVQRLQEERAQLNCRCQELQNQLAEADGEVSRLQNRVKTEETDYYNLEHSYERVCEELQLALGQAQGREVEVQNIREGYERLLDRKEQELSEVLLKMEVLGNSLEETEVKLSEVLKGCTCTSSNLDNDSSEFVQYDWRQEQTTGPPFEVNDNKHKVKCQYSSQLSNSSNETNGVQLNGNHSYTEHARTQSHSIDPSHQCIVTAGNDPDKFMSVIQVLETKLSVTEEKLRDITQRVGESQSHSTYPDALICSQLTQSRATAQHLSLLLHNQAKQNQRFAQETENRSRVLVDWFQAALISVEACRERLQALLLKLDENTTSVDATELEKQLATAAACLQQGERDAEKQQYECRYVCKGDNDTINDKTSPGTEIKSSAKSTFDKMLPSEDEIKGIGRALMREAFVVEKMVSVLQHQDDISQVHLVPGVDEGDVAQRYKDIVSRRIALEMEKRIQLGKAEGDNSESLESTFCRVCVEAELIYTALNLQQQYERMTQGDLQVDDQGAEHLWQGPVKCDLIFVPKRGLADISPPELVPCEEQMQLEGRGLVEEGKHLEGAQPVINKMQTEKEQTWLERLVCRLQRRAQVIRQLSQKISSCIEPNEGVGDCQWVDNYAMDLTWMQDQAKLIYVADRLYLDLELELQQSKAVRDKMQALCQEQDIALIDEQQAFNHTLSQLQEDNRELREQLKCVEQKKVVAEAGNQRLLEDIQKAEDYHEERMQKLEMEFQDRIRELQQIHEEEMKHLHSYYATSACISIDAQNKSCLEAAPPTETATSSPLLTPNSALINELQMAGPGKQVKPLSVEMKEEQMYELEAKLNTMTEDLGNQLLEGEAVAMRESYQRDFEKLKASCEEGFTAMEEMHKKLVCDLQQQHQREVATLLKEKDQLLEEETAATMAAIEAMRKAHKEELERSHWSQHSGGTSDMTLLHIEYERELQLLRKELEVLSVQHTRKCLEIAQMGQELEAGRQAMLQCQRENQELKNKQDLNQRLTEEISHMRRPPSLNGDQSDTTPKAKDLYEMEVTLRVKDAELQSVRQEALSLREELKTALKNNTYVMNKFKGLCSDRTDCQDQAQWDVTLFEDLRSTTWSAKDDSRDRTTAGQGQEDIVMTKSDCDFLKRRERISLTRQIRGEE